MRLRTIALAVALVCGLTTVGQAKKKNVVHPAAKSMKVKKLKSAKRAKVKHQKVAKVRHH